MSLRLAECVYPPHRNSNAPSMSMVGQLGMLPLPHSDSVGRGTQVIATVWDSAGFARRRRDMSIKARRKCKDHHGKNERNAKIDWRGRVSPGE